MFKLIQKHKDFLTKEVAQFSCKKDMQKNFAFGGKDETLPAMLLPALCDSLELDYMDIRKDESLKTFILSLDKEVDKKTFPINPIVESLKSSSYLEIVSKAETLDKENWQSGFFFDFIKANWIGDFPAKVDSSFPEKGKWFKALQLLKETEEEETFEEFKKKMVTKLGSSGYSLEIVRFYTFFKNNPEILSKNLFTK